MPYTLVPIGEVTAGNAAKASTMQKFRDNQIGFNDGTGIADDAILNRHLATGSVNQDSIAAGSIHQGELDTSSEEDSRTSEGTTNALTSAGGFALSVQTRGSAATSSFKAYEGAEGLSGVSISTFGHYVCLVTGNNGSAYAKTFFVNASPPFDLGDGEIPIFTWILMNGQEIECVSTSPAPTWAYNGPTNITPDRVQKVGSELKKFKNIRSIDEETGEVSIQEVEIDMAMKNADIDLLPHPFISNDLTGKQVILLDPPDTGYLLNLHLSGESVNDLIHKDYLRLDNSPINRSVPNGVLASRFRWKNTQSRAGEMIRDKRLKQGPFSEG